MATSHNPSWSPPASLQDIFVVSAGINRTVFFCGPLSPVTVSRYPVTFGSLDLSHEMLQSGPTVVGCCMDGVAQPALTRNATMTGTTTCCCTVPVGFIRHLKDRELSGLGMVKNTGVGR